MPGKFKRFNTNKPTKNYKQLKRALKNASKRFNTVKPKPLTNADLAEKCKLEFEGSTKFGAGIAKKNQNQKSSGSLQAIPTSYGLKTEKSVVPLQAIQNSSKFNAEKSTGSLQAIPTSYGLKTEKGLIPITAIPNSSKLNAEKSTGSIQAISNSSRLKTEKSVVPLQPIQNISCLIAERSSGSFQTTPNLSKSNTAFSSNTGQNRYDKTLKLAEPPKLIKLDASNCSKLGTFN